MALLKVVKDSAYFSRFQVKYRRRREGKTDYYARKGLIVQAKNKYNAKKYRLVTRSTNTAYICQIVYSESDGDRIVAAANSHELTAHGLKVGLKNFAAAYCTGLLCARRMMHNLGRTEVFPSRPADKIGETYEQAEEEDRKPIKAILDSGLKRTTTGARIFAAMKGAVDGGLYVPHRDTRLPGYNKEKGTLDTSVLRKRILSQHVANYMALLKEENPQLYEKRFSEYIREGISGQDIEKLYLRTHESIRRNPMLGVKSSEQREEANKQVASKVGDKRRRDTRMPKDQKIERTLAKKKAFVQTVNDSAVMDVEQ